VSHLKENNPIAARVEILLILKYPIKISPIRKKSTNITDFAALQIKNYKNARINPSVLH
jgi:hypothetical protein